MLILKTSVRSFIVQPVCDRPEVFMPVSRSGQDTRFILEENGLIQNDVEGADSLVRYHFRCQPILCVLVCASACPSVLSGDELGGWRSLWSTLLEAVDSIAAILTG